MTLNLLNLPAGSYFEGNTLYILGIPAGYVAALYTADGRPLAVQAAPVSQVVQTGDGQTIDLTPYATKQTLAAAVENLHNENLSQDQRIADLLAGLAALAPLLVDPVSKTYVDAAIETIRGIDVYQATAIQQVQQALAADEGLLQSILTTQAQHTQQLSTQGAAIQQNATWIGTLTSLATNVKTSLVNAVNEVVTSVAQHTQYINRLFQKDIEHDNALAVKEHALAGVSEVTVKTATFTLGPEYLNQYVKLSWTVECTITLPSFSSGDNLYLVAVANAGNSTVATIRDPSVGAGTVCTLRQDTGGSAYLGYVTDRYAPRVMLKASPAAVNPVASPLTLATSTGLVGFSQLSTALNTLGTALTINVASVTLTESNSRSRPLVVGNNSDVLIADSQVFQLLMGDQVQGVNFRLASTNGTGTVSLGGSWSSSQGAAKATQISGGYHSAPFVLDGTNALCLRNNATAASVQGGGTLFLYDSASAVQVASTVTVVDRRPTAASTSSAGSTTTASTGVDNYANPVTLSQAAGLLANNAYYVTGSGYSLTLPPASQNLGKVIFIKIAKTATGLYPLLGADKTEFASESISLRATYDGWDPTGGKPIAMEARLETSLAQQDALYDGMFIPFSVVQRSNVAGLADTQRQGFVVQRTNRVGLLFTCVLKNVVGNYIYFQVQAVAPNGSVRAVGGNFATLATTTSGGQAVTIGNVTVPVAPQTYEAATFLRVQVFLARFCHPSRHSGLPQKHCAGLRQPYRLRRQCRPGAGARPGRAAQLAYAHRDRPGAWG